jgi:hypothetical protein
LDISEVGEQNHRMDKGGFAPGPPAEPCRTQPGRGQDRVQHQQHSRTPINKKAAQQYQCIKRQKTQRMNKITAFERDSETLYLIDAKGNEIDIPMDEFESFVRTHGKLLQVMVEHDDSVTYHEHAYHIELPEYFDSLSDFKVLIDINQFMDLRESVAVFDIKPVLDRILSTHNS